MNKIGTCEQLSKYFYVFLLSSHVHLCWIMIAFVIYLCSARVTYNVVVGSTAATQMDCGFESDQAPTPEA